MSRKHKTKAGAVIPIRVPEEMQRSIRRIAAGEGLIDADIVRMAITRGLPQLEKLFGAAERTPA